MSLKYESSLDKKMSCLMNRYRLLTLFDYDVGDFYSIFKKKKYPRHGSTFSVADETRMIFPVFQAPQLFFSGAVNTTLVSRCCQCTASCSLVNSIRVCNITCFSIANHSQLRCSCLRFNVCTDTKLATLALVHNFITLVG